MADRQRPLRRFTDDELELARSVNTIDYLMSAGYALKQEGKFWRSHDRDSLVVYPDGRKWYWNSRELHGSCALDFLTKAEEKTFVDAVKQLLGRQFSIRVDLTQPATKPKNTTPPKRSQSHDRVWAYLTQTRGLAADVVRELFDEGRLYESADYHNAVFLQHDAEGKPIYWFMRGTGTQGRAAGFRGEGETEKHGWYVASADADAAAAPLCVFEAVLDLLSFETLLRIYRYGRRRYPCLALGGNAVTALQLRLQHTAPPVAIAACTDADKGGDIAARRIGDIAGDIPVLRLRPLAPYKDWNDMLTAIRAQGTDGELYRAGQQHLRACVTALAALCAPSIERSKTL